MSEEWIEQERKHEREMKRLELEEKKRRDDRDRWEREERRIRLALVVGLVSVVGLVAYGLYLWAGSAGENAQRDNQQRVACLEQGGTPTSTDPVNGDSWLCLFLQKEER